MSIASSPWHLRPNSSFPATPFRHISYFARFRCSAAAGSTGFFTKLGRLIKEKAKSDVEKIFSGFSKTRENLAVVDELLLYWNLSDSEKVLDELEEVSSPDLGLFFLFLSNFCLSTFVPSSLCHSTSPLALLRRLVASLLQCLSDASTCLRKFSNIATEAYQTLPDIVTVLDEMAFVPLISGISTSSGLLNSTSGTPATISAPTPAISDTVLLNILQSAAVPDEVSPNAHAFYNCDNDSGSVPAMFAYS